MFSGTGYTYPPGFPKGDTSATNGKIIVARTYFRTWDPPAPGDENAWPGDNGTSHGTHTASTAAGNKVQASYLGAPPVTLERRRAEGVRDELPRVLQQHHVSGDGSFYNAEGIKALEDAVADGADVINNSWGGGPYSLGGQYDALDAALQQRSRGGRVRQHVGRQRRTGRGDVRPSLERLHQRGGQPERRQLRGRRARGRRAGAGAG